MRKIKCRVGKSSVSKSRLVRSWTHLERQRGGAGFMGGPGEKQIESDKRQLTEKINRLKTKIKKLFQLEIFKDIEEKKIMFLLLLLLDTQTLVNQHYSTN